VFLSLSLSLFILPSLFFLTLFFFAYSLLQKDEERQRLRQMAEMLTQISGEQGRKPLGMGSPQQFLIHPAKRRQVQKLMFLRMLLGTEFVYGFVSFFFASSSSLLFCFFICSSRVHSKCPFFQK
jgi:hypothetical protein